VRAMDDAVAWWADSVEGHGSRRQPAAGSVGMTRKVIYVSFGRLTDKMARDWYIDFLIAKGVQVEYWDIVALVREDHEEYGALQADCLRVFRTVRELEAALRLAENRAALYVMLVSYSGLLVSIFELLSREGCRMLNFAWGALPHEAGTSWRRLLAWTSRPRHVAQQLVNRSRAAALRKLRLVAPFAITFAAGAASIAGSTHTRRVVPVNYFDYDLYVKAKSAPTGRPVAGAYVVFLDGNLPYHSDFGFCGYPQVDAARYYRSLNRFFDLLERAYGCSVVIAAHPRADYDETTFEGRLTHRLVTAELVRDAEFVLTHCSTAMSYAVLNAKPLLFINTEEMTAIYRHSLMRHMHCFARCLDAPLVNIDAVRDAGDLAIRPVNAGRYERYKYQFLTSPQSEHTTTQEIFWRELCTQ
jgi:hypothetical protein